MAGAILCGRPSGCLFSVCSHPATHWMYFGIPAASSPPGFGGFPCLLDDAAVGLQHHLSQLATGRGSDGQSVTGTYKTPQIGPIRSLAHCAISITVSCSSSLPHFWPPSQPLISGLSSAVYLSFSGKRKTKKIETKEMI